MALGKWGGEPPTMGSESVRCLHGPGIHVYFDPAGFDESLEHPCGPVLKGHLHLPIGFVTAVQGRGGSDTSDKDIDEILSRKMV